MENYFTDSLLHWFPEHGRHNLPWQQTLHPTRVWISEIMLQQTQVRTVINYYQRFITKFSTIKLLSEATLDEVLSIMVWFRLLCSGQKSASVCSSDKRKNIKVNFPKR